MAVNIRQIFLLGCLFTLAAAIPRLEVPHREHIYIEDGVEYVDVSKRNETLRLVFT